MSNNIISTVGIALYNFNNEVLLVKHLSGSNNIVNTYGIPSGKLKKDVESEKKGCLRELNEKTGLTSYVNRLVEIPKTYYYTIENRNEIEDYSLKVYTSYVFEGRLKISNETQPEWVNINKLDQFNLLPNVKTIVKEGLKHF